MRRHLREKVVVHENNVQFGTHEFDVHLSDIYWIIRAEFDCSDQGWATVRIRQFVLLLLKCWCYQVLAEFAQENGLALDDAIGTLETHIDFEGFVRTVFGRKCDPAFTWQNYFCATAEELQAVAHYVLHIAYWICLLYMFCSRLHIC